MKRFIAPAWKYRAPELSARTTTISPFTKRTSNSFDFELALSISLIERIDIEQNSTNFFLLSPFVLILIISLEDCATFDIYRVNRDGEGEGEGRRGNGRNVFNTFFSPFFLIFFSKTILFVIKCVSLNIFLLYLALIFFSLWRRNSYHRRSS